MNFSTNILFTTKMQTHFAMVRKAKNWILLFFLFFTFGDLSAQTGYTTVNNPTNCNAQIWCLEYCNGIGYYENNLGIVYAGSSTSFLAPYCDAQIYVVFNFSQINIFLFTIILIAYSCKALYLCKL